METVLSPRVLYLSLLPHSWGLLSMSLEKSFNFFQVKWVKIEDYDFENKNSHTPLFAVFEYLEDYYGKLEIHGSW